jgi:hypothetical protein
MEEPGRGHCEQLAVSYVRCFGNLVPETLRREIEGNAARTHLIYWSITLLLERSSSKMKLRDVKEIAYWALLTVVAATTLAAGTIAVSGNNPTTSRPPITLGKCEFTGSLETADQPGMVKARIHVSNPTKSKQSLALDINLVRSEFVGNAFSRSLSSSDYVKTVASSTTVKKDIAPSKSIEFVVELPFKFTVGLPFKAEPTQFTAEISDNAGLSVSNKAAENTTGELTIGSRTPTYSIEIKQGDKRVVLMPVPGPAQVKQP